MTDTNVEEPELRPFAVFGLYRDLHVPHMVMAIDVAHFPVALPGGGAAGNIARQRRDLDFETGGNLFLYHATRSIFGASRNLVQARQEIGHVKNLHRRDYAGEDRVASRLRRFVPPSN